MKFSRLGRGGMSVVYKARHKFLNRYVALKILSSELMADVTNAKRFREEAASASSVKHPNVIEVFDFGLGASGEAFLVMDFLEGESLSELIETVGAIDVVRALNIFSQVCEGLAELHRHGIIHRDIKPDNIMLIDRDGAEHVCLIDLGIALALRPYPTSSRLTNEGIVVGSPCYVSPEQARGEDIDCRSDIYSLGCTMYEAISGELPFHSEKAEQTMMQHITELPMPIGQRAPRLGVSRFLDNIVLKCLEKNPANRFQSMDELNAELAKVSV